MAWIRIIPDDEAKDELLRTLYDKYSTPSHGVDNVIKVHSINPKSMELHHDYYKHLMTGRSGLSRARREMIAVVVSTANNCHY
jgi:alkylhydroperoxidase family enzyme